MSELPEGLGWHYQYTNHNPDPGTICPDCKQFIGYVFRHDDAPPLPMHPGCYCTYKPVWARPTWPDDLFVQYPTWSDWFEALRRNDPAAYRRWVQRAAWRLRLGWDLGIMECIRKAAQRYNDHEYQPKPPPPDLPKPIPKPPRTHAQESVSMSLDQPFDTNQPANPARGAPRAHQEPRTATAIGNHPYNTPNAALGAPARAASGHVLLHPTTTPRQYDAILVSPGFIRQQDGSDSNWIIPAHVLQDAVTNGLFTALPHYVDHPDKFGFGWRQDPSVRNLAGVATDARWEPAMGGVRATIRLYDTEAGQLLGSLYDQIIRDKQAGKEVPPIGLSIAVFREYEHNEDDGTRVWTSINKVCSVDAVYEPGAAGYIRAALSTIRTPTQPTTGSSGRCQPPRPTGGTIMAPEENRTPDTNHEQTPEEVITEAAPAAPTVDPLHQARQQALNQQGPLYYTDQDGHVHPVPPARGINQHANPRLQRNLETLSAAVERLNSLLAQNEEPNTIQDMGEAPRGPVLYGGYTGLDRVEMAVEAMLTGTRPPDGVRPLTGIRELYMLLSGDYELTGRFHEDRVYLANVTTSTMASIVANRLNKVVVNMFQSYDKWWAPAVTIRDFSSLQDARWITLGGVGELPTVAEGAAYTEMDWDDNAETDSFVKKGGYLGITLETIDKDDTARVMAAPRALAQAAWLTLGKSIAEVFTANSGYGPAMSDGNYLIDSSNHDNEGSTALSYSSWKSTKILMMKYTELNSGEVLGALTRPRLLWVPIDLEDTAIEILAAGEGEVGSADYHVNPEALAEGLRARIRSARNRVITVPFWSDTNDWVAQADPNMYPGLGLGFRYGRTPEIFSVADPRAGLMFTNDTMPIKVRFFFAVGPTDYRAFYKHLVT